jgi:hypothetical protein
MANIAIGVGAVGTFASVGFGIHQYLQIERTKLLNAAKSDIELNAKIEKITTSISQFERIIIERDRANRSDFENMITKHSSEEKMNNLWLGIGTVVVTGVVAGLTGKLVK